MIPVMSRFWMPKPTAAGGPAPGAASLVITGFAPSILKSSTEISVGAGSLVITGYAPLLPRNCTLFGASFYSIYEDDFNGSGSINGTGPDSSSVGTWTYSTATASESGGAVSPANFTASGDGQLTYMSMLCAASLANGETLSIKLYEDFDETRWFVIDLAWGSGNDCTLTRVDTDPDFGGTDTQTFSIGSYSSPSIVFGWKLGEFVDEAYFYIDPDYSTPHATLTAGYTSYPTYSQGYKFEFSCTGSSTSIDYLRFCMSGG